MRELLAPVSTINRARVSRAVWLQNDKVVLCGPGENKAQVPDYIPFANDDGLFHCTVFAWQHKQPEQELLRSLHGRLTPTTPGSASFSNSTQHNRRSTMANTAKFIRKLADGIAKTPQDKGLELTIKVVAYDNGGLQVNGHYFKGPNAARNWLGASGQVTSMIGILAEQAAKRVAA